MHSLLLVVAMLPAASLAADSTVKTSSATADLTALAQLTTIQGVWDSTVTLTSCLDPAIVLISFRALNQFNQHGSLIATSQVAPPPSLGKWEWLGGRRYRAKFRFQRFGVGGVFEGLTQVTREIRLAADRNTFTSVVATELYDLSDTLFARGCGRETARRLY
jgi:hypothetical protein